jgi:ribonuclease R
MSNNQNLISLMSNSQDLCSKSSLRLIGVLHLSSKQIYYSSVTQTTPTLAPTPSKKKIFTYKFTTRGSAYNLNQLLTYTDYTKVGNIFPYGETSTKTFLVNSNKERTPQDYYVIASFDLESISSGTCEGKVCDIIGQVGEADPDYEFLLMSQDLKFKSRSSENTRASTCETSQDKIASTQTDSDTDFQRIDFTNTDSCCIFSFDNDDTIDRDDAMHLTIVNDQVYKLYIHISDVTYYVKENSFNDKDARQRASTIYFGNIRNKNNLLMFDPILTKLMSLDTGKVSYALSLVLTIDSTKYTISHAEFILSKISVKYNLTYDENKLPKNPILAQSIEILRTMVESWVNSGEIIMDSENVVLNTSSQKFTLQDINQGVMIMANSYAGVLLSNGTNSPFIKKKCGGYLIDDANKIKEQIKQSLKEKALVDSEVFQFLKSDLNGSSQYVWTADPVQHIPLNKYNYVYFTSPIRRYADVIIHQVIKRVFFSGVNGRHSKDETMDNEYYMNLLKQLNETESRVKKVQQVYPFYKLVYETSEASLKKINQAKVIDFSSGKLFLYVPQLKMIFSTYLIHYSVVESYRYELRRRTYASILSGTAAPTGEVSVIEADEKKNLERRPDEKHIFHSLRVLKGQLSYDFSFGETVSIELVLRKSAINFYDKLVVFISDRGWGDFLKK